MNDESHASTFERLAGASIGFARLAAAARQEGLVLGNLQGIGGYSLVFDVRVPGIEEPCVAKVPWPTRIFAEDHPDAVGRGYGPCEIHLVSATGPFVLEAPATMERCSEILAQALGAQERRCPGRPLARLLRRYEFEGVPVGIFERSGRDLAWAIEYWRSDAQARIPDIAAALIRLHDSFGPHGDLKPSHIFSAGGEILFIDPILQPSMGSVGYSLPASAAGFRDLGALVAIVLEMWGQNPGWGGRLAYLIVNQGNGRFGRGFEPSMEAARARLLEGASALPGPIEAWVIEVGRAFLDSCTSHREVPSSSLMPDRRSGGVDGEQLHWCKERLLELVDAAACRVCPECGARRYGAAVRYCKNDGAETRSPEDLHW